MSKEAKEKKVQELKEMVIKPLRDLYEESCKIAKSWGNANHLSIKIIEEMINMLIENAKTLKGRELDELKKNYIAMIMSLKLLCVKKAEMMGTKTIPKKVFKAYIDTIISKI